MTAWVALLRGVNVGGITVRSADLRTLFEELGFDDVRTVLASGNVTFSSEGAAPELKARIEQGLRERFEYDAWIVLVDRGAIERAIERFPFDAEAADRQPYVIFGSDDAALDSLAEAAASLDDTADPVARGSGVLYWNPAKGTTVDTPFAKLLARRAYRSTTTNRNLRTLHKILG